MEFINQLREEQTKLFAKLNAIEEVIKVYQADKYPPHLRNETPTQETMTDKTEPIIEPKIDSTEVTIPIEKPEELPKEDETDIQYSSSDTTSGLPQVATKKPASSHKEKTDQLFQFLKETLEKPFTAKEAAKHYQSVYGVSKTNENFALNAVYAFYKDKKIKHVLMTSPREYGFPDWFDGRGMLNLDRR